MNFQLDVEFSNEMNFHHFIKIQTQRTIYWLVKLSLWNLADNCRDPIQGDRLSMKARIQPC